MLILINNANVNYFLIFCKHLHYFAYIRIICDYYTNSIKAVRPLSRFLVFPDFVIRKYPPFLSL